MKKIHRLIILGAMLSAILITFNVASTYSWFTTVGTATKDGNIRAGTLSGVYYVSVGELGVPGETMTVPIAIENTGTGTFVYEIDVSDLIDTDSQFLVDIDSVKINDIECTSSAGNKYYGKVNADTAELVGELTFTFRGDDEAHITDKDWNAYQGDKFDLNVTVRYCQDNAAAVQDVFGLTANQYNNLN